jgi:subtilisin family serine protease
VDTVINRTQITILNKSSSRDSIKAELKSKFASYDLLIWDEVLFSKSSMYNDPIRLDNTLNWHFEAINIEPFWKNYNGNEEVVVAVIDNGFDLNHVELEDKVVLPYNISNKMNINMGNAQNHGTHVASLIAAAYNRTGMVGIAPKAKIMPIKAEDDQGYMTSSYIIDGILYAVKNNADVINLSLGFNLQNIVIPENVQEEIIQSQCKDEELFWKELFDYTEKNNIICVLAAGNSSMLTGLDPFQRSPNTIKVGAYNKNYEIASFSNYGEFTTIFAPGEQVIGAKPNNQYELLDGTSMAAPIISGVAATMKSKNKNYNSSNFKTFLNENAIQKNNYKLFKYKNI